MQEGKLTLADATTLAYRQTGAADERKSVLIVHGFGEHSGRYLALMAALEKAGIRSICADLRGHGNSSGRRGMIKRFEDYLDDVRAVHDHFGAGKDTLVLGHSLGGLIAIHFAARHASRVKALMLSAPYLARELKVNPLRIGLGHLLGKILPTLALPAGISGDMVTHDPAEAALYDNDPLMIRAARAGWFVATEKAMADAATIASRIHAPVYWAHGESDPIASFARSREVFAHLASKDKEFIALPGMRHEPFHEIERARVIDMFVAYAAAH